jgi:hypothetical protein
MAVLRTFAATPRPVFVLLNTKTLPKTQKLFGSNFFVELKPKYQLQAAKSSTSDLIWLNASLCVLNHSMEVFLAPTTSKSCPQATFVFSEVFLCSGTPKPAEG